MTLLRRAPVTYVVAAAFATLALSTTTQAQGLDPAPASMCGVRTPFVANDTVSADSRVLIRFSAGLASDPNDAFLARALGTLTADRIREALDVDVRSRGLGGGTTSNTDAASAVAEGRVLGVRFVLSGTVTRNDDRSIVNWRLVDARSGKEQSSGVITQRFGQADSLVGAMTAALTRAFGKPSFVPQPQDRLTTVKRDALLAYLQALTEADAFDREHLLAADSLLNAAVTSDPSFAAARYRLAELALRQLDYVEQREAERTSLFTKGMWNVGVVLLRDPLNTRALALMGRLTLHGASPQSALPIVAALQRLAPRNAETATLEAQTLRALGRDADALRTVRAAGTAVDRNVSALMVRADLERRVGDVTNACRSLNRAVALDPLFAPAYVWRAVVRSTLGERREGWADAEVAARLGRRDWGELTGALIDLSMRDTVRAKARVKPLMLDASLQEASWLDLVLRAAVTHGLRVPNQAQLAVRQIPCREPRRAMLAREPLLKFLRIPPECGGARPQPKA